TAGFPRRWRTSPGRSGRRADRSGTPRLLAQLGTFRSQRPRAQDHQAATPEGRGSDAGGTGPGARHLQGARAPDRGAGHGEAQGRPDPAESGVPGNGRLAASYLSVTIFTLSPADTLPAGPIALITLKRSSLRSTRTIWAASEPIVSPGRTVTTRMRKGLSDAFSASLSTRNEPLTAPATWPRDPLAAGAAVSRR